MMTDKELIDRGPIVVEVEASAFWAKYWRKT